MALTVADVVAMPDLELRVLAGSAWLDREVRWAHAIEVSDPVPWLRGGELVLTIGIGLPDAAGGRREYLRRLAEAGIAGIGFAAEIRDALPPDVLEEADAVGLPVVEVLGATPFIAVSQAVAQWYSDAALRAERHALAVQESIARAALRHGDRGILRELAKGVAGGALLLDSSGRTVAAHPGDDDGWHETARALIDQVRGPTRSAGVSEHGHRQVLVHSVGLSGAPRGWVAACCPRGDAAHQRLLVNHAAVLLTISMLGIRALRVSMHRERARLVEELLGTGAAIPAELLGSAPFEVAVLAVDGLDDPLPTALDAIADAAAVDDPHSALLLPREGGTLAAVLPAGDERPGAEVRRRIAELTGSVARVGASTARRPEDIAAAIRRAADLLPAEGCYRHTDDVSSWSLLRESFRPGALASFTAAVLGSLREHDRRAGGDLIPTVRAYLDAGESLEKAARALGVHRNTVRARLRTVERVSGRRLDSPGDRLELWFALSAGDLG